MGFHFLDIVIFILLALFGLKGIMQGFVREIMGLLGLVVSVFVASSFAGSFGGWISANIYELPNVASHSLVGFLLLFSGIWLLFIFASSILQKIVKTAHLELLNRILGFGFGALKIFVLLAIITFAVSNVGFLKNKISNFAESSLFYAPLNSLGGAIVRLEIVPNEEIDKTIQKAKKLGKEAAAEAIKGE